MTEKNERRKRKGGGGGGGGQRNTVTGRAREGEVAIEKKNKGVKSRARDVSRRGKESILF